MKNIIVILLASYLPALAHATDTRPNIVWIVVDDMSCHFGYQGEPLAATPNVDRLAKEGIVFSNAYATAPVCSTFRSAMITGMYQTSIGSHHHRSGRGKLKISLPTGVRTVPELFRDAGYFTCIADATGKRRGKQDYNFQYTWEQLYQGIHFSERQADQPFFAQYHLRGGKLRNSETSYAEARKGLGENLTNPANVVLPPYYPDHPVIRNDWAQYIDSVNYTDLEVGRILDDLEQSGVLNETIVFFLTDHGISHARGKQFLYEEGIRIPFVVWAAKDLQPKLFHRVSGNNQIRDEMVAHIDLAANSLFLADISIPDWMQSQPTLDKNQKPRTFVVSARDRCDETVDRIRSVRKGDWKYIRNDYPERPYLQPCNYKDTKPFMPVLRDLHDKGKLNAIQSIHLAETRPPEELYHLPSDPWETNNLADRPEQRKRLEGLRQQLQRWEIQSNDLGRIPESEAMYDSDMNAVSDKMKKRNPEAYKQHAANIQLMKQWKLEGK